MKQIIILLPLLVGCSLSPTFKTDECITYKNGVYKVLETGINNSYLAFDNQNINYVFDANDARRMTQISCFGIFKDNK